MWRAIGAQYPRSKLVRRDDPGTVLEAVCTGEADAALLSDNASDPDFLRRASACSQSNLRITRQSVTSMGVAAAGTRETVAAAKLIRSEIGRLERDGTLESIFFRWFLTSKETSVIFDVTRAQRATFFLSLVLAALLLMLAVIIRQNVRVKRAKRLAEAASQEAVKANQAKSEFLANMSHEIRTPMNGILGMTELAMATEQSDERTEFLSMVKSSADALLIIINDILDYSKIEAGKLELDPVHFDLSEVVGDAMKVMAPLAHQKGLELAYHLDPDVPSHVAGDALRLRQVLLNLTGNAIKFTKKGEIIVRVAVRQHKKGGVQLQFSVRDTGIGIPAEKQSKLFDAFEQADMSTTRQYGGTGLGLAISKRIVQLMDGEIWMESTLAFGSTFHFFIRLAVPENGAGTSGPGSAEDLRDVTVLVVDDNATNLRILLEIGRRWKMQVNTADSGPSGIAKLEEAAAAGQPFQLLLLDEQMPGMGGLEVIRRIRVSPLLKDTKILVLTSADQNSSRVRCREMGVKDYLIKPVKPAELLAKIRTTLGEHATGIRVGMTTTTQRSERSLRILLAEDNVVNQKLSRALLERMGHQVTVAATGAEALSNWSTGDFQLIFMDVHMPDMDGLKATRRIRELEQERGMHIPIIAMTARAMTGDRDKCIEAGMDDYVSKPVSPQALERAIAPYSDTPTNLETCL
jgi:two-component system sensor histidine kinase/response regulator